ncbi:MAG: hypothetical protein K2Y29_01190 [Beijerinckiaceae bacterium]|nr:hypothetical protein [Beijerinckiaceae bacterium]
MSQTVVDFDATVPGDVVASFLGVSLERVRQLAEEGVIPREGKGKFPLRPCVVAYCNWTRDESRKANKSAASSRVQDRRTRLLDLQIAREENRLIETDEALAVVDEIVATFKGELQGLPSRVTKDAALRATIEHEIDRICDTAANLLAERGDALREGGDARASDATDDA